MIPLEILRLAIKGGWTLKEGARGVALPWFEEKKQIWLSIKPTKEQALQEMSYSAGYGQGFGDASVALDPELWIALGRECGWTPIFIHYSACGAFFPKGARKPTSYSSNCNCGVTEQREKTWKPKALRFYDLLLQKQNTAPFWADILANVKK